MEDIMDPSLKFKDKFIENEYKNSQVRIQQKGFLILTVALVLQSAGIYFSNPLAIDIYEMKKLLIFFSGMVATCLCYLLIKKKFPSHSEKGISMYVFFYIIAGAEFVHQIQKTMDLSFWVYYLLGINIQTGCLFLLMSRVRWTQALFVIATTHIYSCFRIIDILNIPGARKTSLISLVIHIFLIFGLMFSSEKENRLTFQNIRAHSQQLMTFEEIIKSVIQSAIIILRNNEVVFFNNTTKSIFDVETNGGVLEKLHMIRVKT